MDTNAIFLLSIAAVIALYDVIIIARKGKRSSISSWVIRTSYRFPSLVFVAGLVFGFVFGHLFWRMKPLDVYECDSMEVREIQLTCKE